MDSSSLVPIHKPSKIYLPKCWNNFLVRLSDDDLAKRWFVVNHVKFLLEQEAATLAKSQVEPFSVAMELVTNAIISINEVKEGVIKDMKRFKTPVTYADMSKGKGVAKEGTLQGRCFASGFDHEGSSSSLFGRQLQKTQVTPYLHKGLSFKEIIASPLPSLAFRDKATPPTCPYNRIKERLFGKGEPSSGATLFDAEHRQNVEVTRNSCKRKWEFDVPVKKVRERRGVGVKFDQERWLSMAPFWEQPPLAHFANPPSRIPASDVASSRVEFRSSLLDDVK